MPSALRVGDIRAALNERLFPSVTVWNRLEGRPRSLGFERALRAEVRDPLWLLTRQWQLGEFRGSDAGSPVFARLQAGTTRPTKYRPAAHPTEALGPGVPIEATVERRPIPLASGDRALSLDLRLAMGRQWLALTAEIGYRQAFIAAYPIVAPNPADKEDADRCAHPEVWQLFAAVAGRTMDGGALYEHLVAAAGNHAYDGVSDVVPADHEALDKAAGRFVAWFRRLFLQPPLTGEEVSEAWIPPRLEYGFAVSAPEAGGEQVYAADEHHHGRLDWYGVDVAPSETLDPVPGSAATGLPEDEPRTMIPVPISFTGMPNTRWWAFEDRATNLGDFDAGTTDLAKLLFLEFALVYGNDWFVIPQTLPAGVIATIRGLAVTNVFGERFWIEPAGTGSDTSWQRWSMFTVDVDEPGGGAEASLPLLSTAAKIQEGPATEEIVLVRDEVANMVWGVETTIQLPSGESRRGLEAAQERGSRPDPGRALLRARGGGAARRYVPGERVCENPGARRPGLRMAADAANDRARRGLERPPLRPGGRRRAPRECSGRLSAAGDPRGMPW